MSIVISWKIRDEESTAKSSYTTKKAGKSAFSIMAQQMCNQNNRQINYIK